MKPPYDEKFLSKAQKEFYANGGSRKDWLKIRKICRTPLIEDDPAQNMEPILDFVPPEELDRIASESSDMAPYMFRYGYGLPSILRNQARGNRFKSGKDLKK